MNEFKYRVKSDIALNTYNEHGMNTSFDEDLINGLLIIKAPDEATADKIRMTFTDIRMWEKVDC